MTNALSRRDVDDLETAVDGQIDKLEQLRFAIESAVQENDEQRARMMLAKLEQTEIDLRGAFQDMRDLLLTSMHDVQRLEAERDDAVNEAESLREDADAAYDRGYEAAQETLFAEYDEAAYASGVDDGYENARFELDEEKAVLEAQIAEMGSTIENLGDALRAALSGDAKALAALRQWLAGTAEDAA